MSALTSCPKCSGRVSVPPGATEDRWVRCPTCGAEYRLNQLLEYQPPELELIDEPAVPAEGRMLKWGADAATTVDNARPIGVGEPVISAQVDDDSDVITFDDSLLLDEPTEVLLGQGPPAQPASIVTPAAASLSDDDFFKAMSSASGVDERDQSAAEMEWPAEDTLEPFEISDNVTHGAQSSEGRLVDEEAVTVFEPEDPGAVRSSDFGLPPRRRSRRGNPLVSFVGIVGGGVFGLAVGYAILMWGFSKDPFALGPKLPDFMVPAALRVRNDPGIVQAAPPNEVDQGDDGSKSADITNPDQPDPQNEDPLSPFADAAANAPRPEPTIDPLDGDAKAADPDPSKSGAAVAAPDDPLANPFGDSTATQRAAKRPAEATTPAPGEADAVGPTAERHYSPAELTAAVDAAKATTEAAVTLPADAVQKEKNEVNGAYYTNLSKIAETLTYLDSASEEQAREKATDAARGALVNAVPTAAQLSELGKLAGYWLNNPSGDGIVLAGTVKNSKPHGKLIESIVQTHSQTTADDPTLITVLSRTPLTGDPSRPVLVAGTIVKDPTANLRGYTGSAKRVVWAELAIDPIAPANE